MNHYAYFKIGPDRFAGIGEILAFLSSVGPRSVAIYGFFQADPKDYEFVAFAGFEDGRTFIQDLEPAEPS